MQRERFSIVPRERRLGFESGWVGRSASSGQSVPRNDDWRTAENESGIIPWTSCSLCQRRDGQDARYAADCTCNAPSATACRRQVPCGMMA